MPYVGNGYAATFVRSDALFVAGVYNGRADITPSHRARIPSPLAISLGTSQGADLQVCGAGLSLSRALYERRYSDAASGLIVAQTMYAHRERRNLLIVHIVVDLATTSSPASPFAPVDIPLSVNWGEPSADIAFEPVHAHASVCNMTAGSTLISESDDELVTDVTVCTSALPASLHVDHVPRHFTFYTALSTSLETADTRADALATFQAAQSAGANALLSEHVSAWQRDVTRGGVYVSGNDQLAAMINASLYYLASSVRSDWPYGVSPGGIPSNAYNGHVFWDMDTWMLPALLPFAPDLARSMVRYRIDRLDAARSKARAHGLAGAWYPWESASSGVECTPQPTVHREGELEIHVNGDVARTVAQVFSLSLDAGFVSDAYPMLRDTANFWASRARCAPAPPSSPDLYERCEVLNVQGPDESHYPVNNSVYTNAVAAANMRDALWAISVLQLSESDSMQAQWQSVADTLVLPFDAVRRIHLQYDGYVDDMINQADVGLLQYPLGVDMTRDVALNDLRFYTNVTRPNGYFTGDSAYCIAWLALGERDSAQAEFAKAFDHVAGPFNVWKETLDGGHWNFLTGAGGFLQSVVYGWGGMRISPQGVRLDPSLPDGVDEMWLSNIRFATVDLSVYWNASAIVVTASDGGVLALEVVDYEVGNATIRLEANQSVTWRRAAHGRVSLTVLAYNNPYLHPVPIVASVLAGSVLIIVLVLFPFADVHAHCKRRCGGTSRRAGGDHEALVGSAPADDYGALADE